MPISSVRRPKDKRWVEAFVISHSKEGKQWEYYNNEDGEAKVFQSLYDSSSIECLYAILLQSNSEFF